MSSRLNAQSDLNFKYWKGKEAEQLTRLIRTHRNDPDTAYAVFDADNTIWEHDLEEALLPWLENRGILTRNNLDPSLKLIPFRKNESLFSYYYRLSEIDNKVAYPWIAQAFSGFTLQELKTYVDSLYDTNEAIPVTYYGDDGEVVHDEVHPPIIYAAQRELINTLQDQGIEVYVVTAALEELVRMVVSDPQYGINIPPENVIGVTTLLKDRKSDFRTTARKQIERGHFWDEQYTKDYHYSLELTPYLWTPATWYVGKMAAIREYIEPVEQPVLVAGDSPNDHWMLFYSNVEHGGLRLWVNRKQKYMEATREAMQKRALEEKKDGEAVYADQGWIIQKPEELHQ